MTPVVLTSHRRILMFIAICHITWRSRILRK